MIKKYVLPLFVSLILSASGTAQVSVKDSSVFATVVYATYSYQFPQGDLTSVFGSNSTIGAGLMFKTKSNWLVGFEGNYIFGGNVQNGDSLLKNIATPDGFVIDANGYYADIVYYQRGYSLYFKFGKLISVLAPNPNSGFTIMAGGGYIDSKVRIHNPGNTAYQLSGDYKKGYDRYNAGFALTGSLGYSFLSNTRLINVYAGFEFIQAWTKNKRDFFFDKGYVGPISYSTQYYGINVRWMIPLYKRTPKEYYLY